MRFIRAQMHVHRRVELSVPQFRALVFVSRHEDGSLSALAEQLGLSLPATSRMVQVLVQRGLLERAAGSGDRRCVALSLTARGRTSLRAARRATQAALARRFEVLSASECARISEAMDILSGVFAPDGGRLEVTRS